MNFKSILLILTLPRYYWWIYIKYRFCVKLEIENFKSRFVDIFNLILIKCALYKYPDKVLLN